MAKRNHEKVCVVCNSDFMGYTSKDKFCSDHCRWTNPAKKMSAKKSRDRRRAIINRYKLMKGCENPDCSGHPRHPAALQFDHVRGEKKFEIGYAPSKAWVDVKTEIKKCNVLCANCHFVKTHVNKENVKNRKDYEPHI